MTTYYSQSTSLSSLLLTCGKPQWGGGGGGGEEEEDTRHGTEKRCSHNLQSDPRESRYCQKPIDFKILVEFSGSSGRVLELKAMVKVWKTMVEYWKAVVELLLKIFSSR